MSLYKTTEGKLLVKSSQLMTECCCGDCSEDIDCNTCTPNLCDQYTITFSSLSGALAPYNGVHTVTYDSFCLWSTFLDSPIFFSQIRLFFIPPGTWIAQILHIFTGCNKQWGLTGADPCNPIDTYPATGCVDTNCSGMCAANTGGIATVS